MLPIALLKFETRVEKPLNMTSIQQEIWRVLIKSVTLFYIFEIDLLPRLRD